MKDFIVDFENKTLFANGDIRTGDCDVQNQRLIIITGKGSFKESPLATVGARDYLDNEDKSAFLREVRNKLTADGMKVNAMAMNGTKLEVDANY